jgi:hypothetical protein
MKKSFKNRNSQRKLMLEKTTLRTLDALDLSQVAGGEETFRACPREINTVQDPCHNG